LAGRGGIVDPETHHTVLPVIIARVEGGVFRALKRWEAVAGDPYLTRGRQAPAPVLRVVS
jgi:branched-chain amino acid transport system substrate-binding protein